MCFLVSQPCFQPQVIANSFASWEDEKELDLLLQDAKKSPEACADNLIGRLKQLPNLGPKILWKDVKVEPRHIPACPVPVLLPKHGEVRLRREHHSDEDDEEEEESFDRWRSFVFSGIGSFEIFGNENAFVPNEFDQDIIEFNRGWQQQMVQQTSDMFLQDLCSKLTTWQGSNISPNMCVMRLLQHALPLSIQTLLTISYVHADTLAIALYRVTPSNDLELIRIMEMDTPVLNFAGAVICPLTQNIAIVKRNCVTVFCGETGALISQTHHEKHEYTGCCWMPLGGVLLITWVHARGGEGKVVSWRPRHRDPYSLLEFKGSHILQIKASAAISPKHVLCGVLRSDFTVCIAVWTFDVTTQPERESLKIIAHLTTPVFSTAPSMDWTNTFDLAVYGAGKLSIWSSTEILKELEQNAHSAAAVRPMLMPIAKATYHISDDDPSGMFAVNFLDESFVVVNLGSRGVGFVDTESGSIIEFDFGLDEIIGVGKVASAKTMLYLSIRTANSLHLRLLN
jgi:hypothetical protein